MGPSIYFEEASLTFLVKAILWIQTYHQVRYAGQSCDVRIPSLVFHVRSCSCTWCLTSSQWIHLQWKRYGTTRTQPTSRLRAAWLPIGVWPNGYLRLPCDTWVPNEVMQKKRHLFSMHTWKHQPPTRDQGNSSLHDCIRGAWFSARQIVLANTARPCRLTERGQARVRWERWRDVRSGQTPENSRMSPENHCLVQMHFLLKQSVTF